ncbi:unnamed protein product [Anisakis simplex]|uniref:Krev interaction trapped protein 1 (inferred by orthology to a human protein) n=1 Tax=Anisakis simplex TaxID=6269 RepID=A0A158PN64_ANISI|nr:unnamed protein product [Anisakis simplex]
MQEISIAIVQLRQSALTTNKITNKINNRLKSQPSENGILTANDYDILLINEPSSSSRVSNRLQLPSTRVPHNGQPAEVALNAVRHFYTMSQFGNYGLICNYRYQVVNNFNLRRIPRRAVAIPLWDSAGSNANTKESLLFPGSPHPLFYCVSVLEMDKNPKKCTEMGHFENLAHLLNCCMSDNEVFNAETMHLICRLEDDLQLFLFRWLRLEQHRDENFIAKLFNRPISLSRIRSCAHNPAYDPEQTMLCHNMMGHGKNAEAQRKSCDLAEEVRRSNDARARMIGDEKYDMFIMNPLFGSGLPYSKKNEAPNYFAAGRKQRCGTSFSSHSVSSGESWSEQFPLHKAAYDDNVDETKKLLAKGLTANEVDNASWTPLHYCAFYNNLKTMEVLLLNTSTDVNVPNKAGSTALHFAALQANAYMIELLLSHSAINVNARDSKGQRALDLCSCVPKAEYQKAARLLRDWNKLDKIQVEMMDGGNAQLALFQGNETTAGQLHAEMCKELKMNASSASLFAIWICSSRLSTLFYLFAATSFTLKYILCQIVGLQLKADHKPLLHMSKWHSKVAKFGNEETTNTSTDDETPKIYFRRDARVTLRTEKATKLTPMALSLLYEEARHNYMKGLYPCADGDIALLASIILRIIHGNAYKLTEKMLEHVIPAHRIPSSESAAKAVMNQIEVQNRKLDSKNNNLISLQQSFLQICWRFCVYGSTFFDAIVFMKKPMKGSLPVHVGVNDYGLHLLNSDTKTLFNTYPLKGLQWIAKPDRPYLEVHAAAFGHDFTLRTAQASHINNLLTRLTNTTSATTKN